jgi:hypothetical protein
MLRILWKLWDLLSDFRRRGCDEGFAVDDREAGAGDVSIDRDRGRALIPILIDIAHEASVCTETTTAEDEQELGDDSDLALLTATVRVDSPWGCGCTVGAEIVGGAVLSE